MLPICLNPAGHSSQVVQPSSLLVVDPFEHSSQEVVRLDSLLAVSIAQSLQPIELPNVSSHVPGGHSLQSSSVDAPVAEEYVPNGHTLHVRFVVALEVVLQNPTGHR